MDDLSIILISNTETNSNIKKPSPSKEFPDSQKKKQNQKAKECKTKKKRLKNLYIHVYISCPSSSSWMPRKCLENGFLLKQNPRNHLIERRRYKVKSPKMERNFNQCFSH
jgi:hypothetical protein